MTRLDETAWFRAISHSDTELNPAATVEAIAAFESVWDISLPESHRQFLLRANGGVVGYVRLFGIGAADGLDLEEKIREIREYAQSTATGPVLPFANTWGGSYYCYDLATDANGDFPVLFWEHEYAEDDEYRHLLWRPFADNFNEFLLRVCE